MKYITKLLILYFLLNTGCQLDKNGAKKSFWYFPIVFDSIGVDKFFYFKEDSPTWLTTSNYKLYFIGKVQDTIFLNPYLNFGPFAVPTKDNQSSEDEEREPDKQLEGYFLGWTERKGYKFPEDSNVEILVDTSNTISNSYPTLLKNLDKDTIIIGYGQQIPLIMEAKDSLGNWKPIQKRFVYMCGVGVGSIILPPKECAITLSPIYNGNYKTEIRLSFGGNHSNTFYGNINYRQFKSMFDEKGDYNEEYKREMEDKATNR